MAFGFKYGTNYDYETSEDESLSFIGTISWGTIILNDRRDDSKLKINYRCASNGNGKGLPVNMSHSDFSNWSGGDAVVANRHFYDGVFPCQGYMIGAGGGIGLTDSAENSASVTLVLFGILASVLCIDREVRYTSHSCVRTAPTCRSARTASCIG